MGGGPRYFNEDGMLAAMEFAQAASDLHAEKSRCPADDIMSIWTAAEVDGEPLSVDMVISDCLLLLDGGAETTRTVIARTILDLIAHPDQWAALKAGADLTVATEEFIRWVTPIHNMCRVAAVDAEVGGQPIEAGQQLVLMYSSANRDPSHFADPERYDVSRSPNNHIAFGFGTHFCLGAALARMEIRLFFEELVRRVRSMRLVPGTEPVEMPNAFVYGLRSAEVEFEFERSYGATDDRRGHGPRCRTTRSGDRVREADLGPDLVQRPGQGQRLVERHDRALGQPLPQAAVDLDRLEPQALALPRRVDALGGARRADHQVVGGVHERRHLDPPVGARDAGRAGQAGADGRLDHARGDRPGGGARRPPARRRRCRRCAPSATTRSGWPSTIATSWAV